MIVYCVAFLGRSTQRGPGVYLKVAVTINLPSFKYQPVVASVCDVHYSSCFRVRFV